MTAFVLLNKITGDLYIGYRISFYDVKRHRATTKNNFWYTVMPDYDGWIIESPKLWPCFITREQVEKYHEILSEL